MIAAGGHPVPVPDSVIDALRSGTRAGALCELARGAKVEIVAGPFAGLTAELQHLTAQDRVRVLLRLLDAVVAADIDRAAVRAAA